MKKIIGISLILLAMLGIGLAIRFDSLQEVQDYVTQKKANQTGIDKSKVNLTYTSEDLCDFDYESETIGMCKVCYNVVYTGTPYVEFGNCFRHNISMELDDIKDGAETQAEDMLDRQIDYMEEEGLMFTNYDFEGESKTLE